MLCSRNFQIVISFFLISVSSVLLGDESNEIKVDVKFEIDNTKSQLWISDHHNTPGKGPIKPTHVAVLQLRNLSMPLLTNNHEDILQILSTPSGKTLSEQQRKFLTASDAVVRLGTVDIRSHGKFFLYAVSEDEAKKTVRAYLEVPIERNKAKKREYEKKIQEMKTKINSIEKELPAKKQQTEEAESKYKEAKKARYFPLDDGEANDRAKEIMFQTDKMLDVLEIELAGIQEKIQSIEKFRRLKSLGGHDFSKGTLDKLEQMLVEQMVELKSAEARKQTALKIRSRDKAFLDLYKQWKDLDIEANGLIKTMNTTRAAIGGYERELKNPEPAMRLPAVYQNKVTIYPVLTQ